MIVIQCRAQELVAGNKQHYKIRRILELIPVTLGRQFLHAFAHVFGVANKMRFPFLVVCGFDGREIGIQRGFNVHHNFTTAGHAHDHVGAHRAIRSLSVFLLVKITVFDHARQFGQTFQRHLSPLAADLGPGQRLDQIARFTL